MWWIILPVPAAAADAISPGRRSDGGKLLGRCPNWTTQALPRCSSQTAAGQSSATGGRAHLSMGRQIKLRFCFLTSGHQLNQPSGANGGAYVVPTCTLSDPVNEHHDEPSAERHSSPDEDGSPSQTSFLPPPMLRFPVATEACRQAATGSRSRRGRTNTTLWVGSLWMTFRLAPVRYCWKSRNLEKRLSTGISITY